MNVIFLISIPYPGAGENTLRRLALFLYLDHPTKSDVTSGKIAGWAAKQNLNTT